MKQGIESLYSLQKSDDGIKSLDDLMQEIPKKIQELELERDGKKAIVETAEGKLRENAKEREKLEKDILVVREKIKKYREQMGKVTTNKEYQGFMAEIKFEEGNISAIEEKIIEKMVESDEIVKEIRESEVEYKKIAGEYNKEIKVLTQDMVDCKTRLEEAGKNRQEIRGRIPAALLRVYDQLWEKKGGKAVSYVESDFCGVCNVKIRPQRLNEIIVCSDLFFCENCGRILFYRVDRKQPEAVAAN